MHVRFGRTAIPHPWAALALAFGHAGTTATEVALQIQRAGRVTMAPNRAEASSVRSAFPRSRAFMNFYASGLTLDVCDSSYTPQHGSSCSSPRRGGMNGRGWLDARARGRSDRWDEGRRVTPRIPRRAVAASIPTEVRRHRAWRGHHGRTCRREVERGGDRCGIDRDDAPPAPCAERVYSRRSRDWHPKRHYRCGGPGLGAARLALVNRLTVPC